MHCIPSDHRIQWQCSIAIKQECMFSNHCYESTCFMLFLRKNQSTLVILCYHHHYRGRWTSVWSTVGPFFRHRGRLPAPNTTWSLHSVRSPMATECVQQLYITPTNEQWRQRLSNFGDGLTQRGMYPGAQKSPSGVQGRRPNRGSSGRTPLPKLIVILEMDVKLIFYGGLLGAGRL